MNILIIEDQAEMAASIQSALSIVKDRFPDATVTIASTLAAGRAFIDSIPAPDVVVLDLELPDSGWRATVSLVDVIEERSPVVIITGHPEGIIRELLTNPAVEILSKGPCFFENLLGYVIRAVKRGGKLQQVADNLNRMKDLLPNAPAK